MSGLRIDGAGYSASSQHNLKSVQKEDNSISVFTKDSSKVKEPQEPEKKQMTSVLDLFGMGNEFETKKAKRPKGEVRQDENGVEYIAKMKRGKEVKRTYVDEDNNVVMTMDIKYDSKGNKIKTTMKSDEGKKLYTNEYKYDKNGNMSLHEEKDYKGNIVSTEEFTYNDKNQKIKEISKDENGQVKTIIEHKYDEKGLKSESIERDGNGEYLGTRYYRYAPNGFEMGTSFKDKNGEVTHTYNNFKAEDLMD